MPTLNNELAALLGTVQTPGDFYAAGTSAMPLPRIDVDGIGPIALPLLGVQADALIALAERAPFGRGEETLIDTSVRRTWQIGADQVRIQGAQWDLTLAAIVARVASGLGVAGTVLPELYKLLVYDQGSFFVSHRDTEKTPGMFATLIIAPPSLHVGGELIVHHGGREARLDLCCADPSELAFAAFFADCPHEVLPVASGCRLVLVYNLVRLGHDASPTPPNHQAQTARLAALLRQWADCKAWAGEKLPEAPAENPPENMPNKRVYLLEHAYTPAELCFQGLKGADAAAAAVLNEAAAQAGCDLHVALLTIEESGAAEHTGYSSSHRWGHGRHQDNDDDEFEIGEIFDRTFSLNHWGRPDGHPAALGALPFFDEEMCPDDVLDAMEPDEEHFHEATGNEGASFERSYQRAALVLWPLHRRLAVLNQGGLPVTLPWLAEQARRWVDTGAGQDSPLWREAHELAGHMLRTWPKPDGYHLSQPNSPVAQLLVLLAQLGDAQHIDTFVANTVAAGSYCKHDKVALLGALNRLSAARAAELLECVVAGNAGAGAGPGIGACADLMASAALVGRLAGRLHAAASALVDALPGDAARPPQAGLGWRMPAVDADLVFDLMTALCLIDTGLADRASAQLLAWPASYGLDAVVLPAVCRLIAHPPKHPQTHAPTHPPTRQAAAIDALRAACLAHLQPRLAQTLAPPADWSRACTLPCRCSHCHALTLFLTSPTEPRWAYKAAEASRAHLLASIKTAACDVDCVTDRQGRPYALVCTKNQASHDRRCAQRQHDLTSLATLTPGLRGIAGGGD